ncbi:MAG: DNA helicase UvrBC [Clostridiaceae bacterium]|nr:DNA helicase UvrBC [Clostridiaceae bacterium]
MALCQICKMREATVYFTQIVNGRQTNLFVCKECAGTHGVKLDLNTLLTGLLGISDNQDLPDPTVTRCDRCGMTAEDFNRTGRMGCSRCYQVFHNPMYALLTRIHGNTRHRGKAPKRLERIQAVDKQLDELKKQLEECIRTENYEKAAQIRDEIRFLTSQKGGATQ